MKQKKFISKWKSWADNLKYQAYVLYFSYKNPGTPWYAKICAAVVAAYAFSPIDHIPDFIPILGYLDDLILIPLGVALVIKLIPDEVQQQSREKARDHLSAKKPVNWIAGGIIITLWTIGLGFCIFTVYRHIITKYR